MKLKITNKGWMIVSTLGFISILFIYYFLVYVGGQESTLIQNKMRVLAQIEKNIKFLQESYLNNANTYLLSNANSEKNPVLKTKEELSSGQLEGLTQGIHYSENEILFVNQNSQLMGVDYGDFFGQNLILRQDVFDFILVYEELGDDEKKTINTLYSNNPYGDILYSDSLTKEHSILELDFGFTNYNVFKIHIENLSSNRRVFLAGFVDQSKFNSKKREISLVGIMLISILVILIVLSFPVLKLKIMSNAERLYISDVLYSGTSILIGPAVTIVLFLGVFYYFKSSQYTVRERLDDFGARVEQNFLTEIDSISTLLQNVKEATSTVDSLKLHELKGASYFSNLYKSDSSRRLAQRPGELSFISYNQVLNNREFETHGYFNGIFWVDDEFDLVMALSAKRNPSTQVNLKHRDYIKKAYTKNLIEFRDKKFAIESIRSVNDGSFEMGMGMGSGLKKFPVIAISTVLSSVMGPIVEEGYGFCIFDKSGQTLFHSNIDKNLNENFLNETNGAFNSYVRNDVGHLQAVSYGSKNQFIKVRPLQELDDLFLAVFVDKQFVNSPNAIALYTTLAMEAFFLIILTGFYFLIYLTTFRGTRLKTQVFAFNWLRPYDTDRHHQQYKRLLYLNIVGILYLILAWVLSNVNRDVDAMFSSLLFVAFGIMALNFFVLSEILPYQKRIFTTFYEIKKWRLLSFGLLSGTIVLFLILNRLFIIKPTFLHIFEFIYYLLPLFLVWLMWTGRVSWKEVTESIEKRLSNLKSRLFPGVRLGENFRAYKYFLMSWLVLISILPTVCFYHFNYRKEQEIYQKQQGYRLHENSIKWQEEKKVSFPASEYNILEGDTLTFSNQHILNRLSKNNLNIALQNETWGRYSRTDSVPFGSKGLHTIYDSLYSRFRIPFNRYGKETHGFTKNYDVGQRWVYQGNELNILDSKGERVLAKFERKSGHTKSILQDLLELLILLVFVVFICIFFYRMISFMVSRIFGLDFKKFSQRLLFNDIATFSKDFLGEDAKDNSAIIYQLHKLSGAANSYNNIMVVEVNASHVSTLKNSVMERYSSDKEVQFDCVDMYDFESGDEDFSKGLWQESDTSEARKNEFGLTLSFEELKVRSVLGLKGDKSGLIDVITGKKKKNNKEKRRVVFMEHFEFGYNDSGLNKIKLNILQRLIDNPMITVIISSEINPNKVYDFYQDRIRMLQAKTVKEENRLEFLDRVDALKVDYKKWLNLLGSFIKVTIPISKIEISAEPTEDIKKELEHGSFLNSIAPYFKKLPAYESDYKEYKWHNEDYVLKIQEMSYSYYFSIWNSLSVDERYIVYDIAKDKFVNTNNVDGILDLLQKGILVYDHSLRLMNESFSNFVLSRVSSDEALERELESRKKGKWNSASAILIILIFSLIIFISFGQVSILNDLNTLLSALGAVFALFLRVGGIFSFGSSNTG